jgi:hypothetical protein
MRIFFDGLTVTLLEAFLAVLPSLILGICLTAAIVNYAHNHNRHIITINTIIVKIKLPQAVMLLTYILGVPGLNVCQDTSYTYREFSRYSSVPPGKFRDLQIGHDRFLPHPL